MTDVLADRLRQALKGASVVTPINSATTRHEDLLPGEIDRIVDALLPVLNEAYALSRADRAAQVLNEFVNVRGDYMEPAPLAAMVKQLADALGVELRGDWSDHIEPHMRRAVTADGSVTFRDGHDLPMPRRF